MLTADSIAQMDAQAIDSLSAETLAEVNINRLLTRKLMPDNSGPIKIAYKLDQSGFSLLYDPVKEILWRPDSESSLYSYLNNADSRGGFHSGTVCYNSSLTRLWLAFSPTFDMPSTAYYWVHLRSISDLTNGPKLSIEEHYAVLALVEELLRSLDTAQP